MKAWDSYWFGPVLAARPYLILKGFLLLLTQDIWRTMIAYGGRYGLNDFNVAHFRWLDTVQPIPTPWLYYVLLSTAGLLAFISVFVGVNRFLLGGVFVLYTYSWMMSMMDSYQHHYLLSLVLLAFVFFPDLEARTVFTARPGKKEELQGPGWAYCLLSVIFAVVYAYTALAKTEPAWRSGDVLRRFVLVPGFLSRLGLEDATFYGFLGGSAAVIQVLICVAYLLAPLRDRGNRWVALFCSVGFVLAMSFHLGIEYVGMAIGWFSWYMVMATMVFFLPGRMIFALGRFVTWPLTRGTAPDGGATPPAKIMPGWRLALQTLAAALLLMLVGYAVDLPGGVTTGSVATVALLVGCGIGVMRGRADAVRPWLTAAAVSATLMWLSIATSQVRFDYYRKSGSTFQRHGRYQQALEAYIKADRYAPPGEERGRRVEELRRLVAQEPEP